MKEFIYNLSLAIVDLFTLLLIGIFAFYVTKIAFVTGAGIGVIIVNAFVLLLMLVGIVFFAYHFVISVLKMFNRPVKGF